VQHQALPSISVDEAKTAIAPPPGVDEKFLSEIDDEAEKDWPFYHALSLLPLLDEKKSSLEELTGHQEVCALHQTLHKTSQHLFSVNN